MVRSISGSRAGARHRSTAPPGRERDRPLRRHHALERRFVRRRARPHRRPHRPERRRQDDDVQLPVAALRVQRRRGSASRAARCSRRRRTASPRSASAAPSRTWRCSGLMSVRQNIMLGGHSRTRSGFFANALAAAAACGARKSALGSPVDAAGRPARSRRGRRRAGDGPAVRHAEARRARPRAGERAEAAAARRAGRRPQPRGGRDADGAAAPDPRRARA